MIFQNQPLLYFLTWKLGLQAALTQTTRDEGECLAKHAHGKQCLVEIGVWHGVNTLRFRRGMAPNGTLYAIDPFPPGRLGRSWHRPIAYGEVARANNGTVVFLEHFSEIACVQFTQLEKRPIDFLFIDGDHRYEGVSKDWNAWTPLIQENGIVALHDSRSHAGRPIDDLGPARFTREVVSFDRRFDVVDQVDSLTVLRRK